MPNPTHLYDLLESRWENIADGFAAVWAEGLTVEETARRLGADPASATVLTLEDIVLGFEGDEMPGDLHEAGNTARFLIRDRDAKFTAAFDAVPADADIRVVTTGTRIPRMNSIMERWIQTCRRELLDRTLIWDQRHLPHVLRAFESFHNDHRPHRTLRQAAPA